MRLLISVLFLVFGFSANAEVDLKLMVSAYKGNTFQEGEATDISEQAKLISSAGDACKTIQQSRCLVGNMIQGNIAVGDKQVENPVIRGVLISQAGNTCLVGDTNKIKGYENCRCPGEASAQISELTCDTTLNNGSDGFKDLRIEIVK